jgi:hypothetical protein
MEQVLHRAENLKLAGVRLVQAAYHNRSLALYTKLGFNVREPLSVIQGTPPGIRFPGYHVRPANEADLNSCNQLCYKIHVMTAVMNCQVLSKQEHFLLLSTME